MHKNEIDCSEAGRVLEEVYRERLDELVIEYGDFLYHIAFLDYITPHRATELSGRRDAAAVLEALLRCQLYIERQPHAEPRYVLQGRFHRLLLEQAGRCLTADRLNTIRAQAAAILERDGQLASAFDLYAAADRWDAALDLIGRQAILLPDHAERRDMVALVRRVPADRLDGSAHCHYWLAQAEHCTRWRDRVAHFERACMLYARNGAKAEMVLCMAAIVNALTHAAAASAKIRTWMARLDAALRNGEQQLLPGIRLRAYNALISCMHFMEFNDYRIHRWVIKLARLLECTPAGEDRVKGLTTQLRFYIHFGYLQRAQSLLARYGDVVAATAVPPQLRIWWHIICGEYFYAAGMAEQATAVLERAWEWAQGARLAAVAPIIRLHQLYCCLGMNEMAAAGQHIDDLERTLPPNARAEQVMFGCARSWHAMLQHRPSEALAHAQMACRLSVELAMPIPRSYAELNLVVALMACGDSGRAEKLLHKLVGVRHFARSDFFAPHLDLLSSELARIQGRTDDAADHLRQAFRTTRDARMLGAILWLPERMAAFCARALEHGVEVDSVTSLITTRKIKPPDDSRGEAWPWPVRIYALGKFSVYRRGQASVAFGKTQRKPLEFLKTLIALDSDGVDMLIITQLLWPDAEGDAAQRSFHSTLHRLRKLLGCDAAIALSDRKVSLNFDLCWLDVAEFERLADTQGRASIEPGQWQERLTQVLAIYRADFLADEEVMGWSMPLRDRLRSKFLRFVACMGDSLERSGRHGDAIELYQRGLEVDCLAEDLYRRIMDCRRQRGELAEALNVYRRCRNMLSIVLGIMPSAKTMDLYREITKHGPTVEIA